MNKSEKLICLVLGAVLAWYIFMELPKNAQAKADAAKAAQAAAVAAETNAVPAVAAVPETPAAPVAPAVAERPAVLPSVPEKTVKLANDELELELSSWGAAVKSATLLKFARDRGEISAENPAVALDFSGSPLGAIGGVVGLESNAAYELRSQTSNEVVFANAFLVRRITLRPGYQVAFEDTPQTAGVFQAPQTLSLGVMRMGDSKNDQLSVDSHLLRNAKGKSEVIHHYEGDSPLKPYLVGGLSGGCSGSSSAAGLPARQVVEIGGAQGWIALKNRFFTTALVAPSDGFTATVERDVKSAAYRPDSVSVAAKLPPSAAARSYTFFVGPKKQSLLWDLGMRDVMDFGMWRWICYPLVWVLNLFNGWIPNYGIAIILLTILVRILFWPLTHKSTVGMKKMQEVQPLMKEIQVKYKDNPQRLQQETWALYREHKVNPLSSCLPMLIQIPVFIALFNVLRSAVELRYAGFLWIGDLSEPEGLFASWFPFGGLNILPVLMAVSTALQSYFTPSTGDKNQQKMMMIMMPAMMLVMFYSFPAALSLYWFLSNLFSIVQMWMIRRSAAK